MWFWNIMSGGKQNIYKGAGKAVNSEWDHNSLLLRDVTLDYALSCYLCTFAQGANTGIFITHTKHCHAL